MRVSWGFYAVHPESVSAMPSLVGPWEEEEVVMM